MVLATQKVVNMQYWLLKSEKSTWSWQQQVQANIECWSGVRNYQARNNLKAMKINDLAFFYHSNDDKQIVGIVQIVKEFYKDPTLLDNKDFVAVDVKTFKELNNPVSLQQIKNNVKLQHIALVNHSRLSVMPIDKESFFEILGMSDTKIANTII